MSKLYQVDPGHKCTMCDRLIDGDLQPPHNQFQLPEAPKKPEGAGDDWKPFPDWVREITPETPEQQDALNRVAEANAAYQEAQTKVDALNKEVTDFENAADKATGNEKKELQKLLDGKKGELNIAQAEMTTAFEKLKLAKSE